ncbi:hypothetical protein [Bacillus infantis]|uniref:hypothetical protein n=1 Tax=Bacillus infantis TaxID=324767 RepID=UPI0020061099|nr:hypothetical protein [Bacillus infantis]
MRRLTTHQRFDREEGLLQVVTIWEEAVKKEEVKKLIPYSKMHDVLVKDRDSYSFKVKRA